MLSEISQGKKDKYVMVSLMWSILKLSHRFSSYQKEIENGSREGMEEVDW